MKTGYRYQSTFRDFVFKDHVPFKNLSHPPRLLYLIQALKSILKHKTRLLDHPILRVIRNLTYHERQAKTNSMA